MTHDEDNYDDIEARLRTAAPAIRPGVRERILEECADRQRGLRRARQRRSLALRGAVAAICLAEWLAATVLDGQRLQLIEGRSETAPAPTALVAVAPDAVGTTLRLRSQTLALLLDSADFVAPKPAQEASNVKPNAIAPTPDATYNS